MVKIIKDCITETQMSCLHCDKENLAFEFIELTKEKRLKIFSKSNQIVLINNGALSFTHKDVVNKEITMGESILIPAQCICFLNALQDTGIIIIKLDPNVNFYNYFPFELSSNEYGMKNKYNNIEFLYANQRLIDFSNSIKDYLCDNIRCSYFYNLKVREFFLLIKNFYDNNTVSNFIQPIYNNDFVFSNSILEHIDKIRTVKDMAKKLKYSLSGFEKKFKRVYNVPPYQWMQKERAKKIYHELICSRKTFTQIASDFDFSSPAHFNDFCKIFFKNTPGGLRKNIGIEQKCQLAAPLKSIS